MYKSIGKNQWCAGQDEAKVLGILTGPNKKKRLWTREIVQSASKVHFTLDCYKDLLCLMSRRNDVRSNLPPNIENCSVWF